MKAGDLVKVLYNMSFKEYAYGILTEDNQYYSEDYKEVWIFKYPPSFGEMPSKKAKFPPSHIKHVKTEEDW